MDRSPGNSYLLNTSISQTPQKTNVRLKQLEREIAQYRDTITQKNEQIQYLSNKNNQLLNAKSNSNSKGQSDIIFESSLQEQIERLTLKLNDKTKEHQRLYQKYSALENDMATLQDFATDLDRERKFLADQLANLEIHAQGDEVVGELENKLVLMSTEIMRLGQLSRNKTQQNNQLRFKIKSFEQEVQQLQANISQKQKTLVQYRQKLRNLQRRAFQVQSNSQYDNESNYKVLSLQIQRLNILLHNKLQQINTLEHKNRSLEQRLRSISQIGNNNTKNGELEIQVQRLNKILSNSKLEISDLEQQFKRVKKQNKELSDDCDKNRRLVKKLENQLQQMQRTYVKNQNEKIRIEVQMSEKKILQQKTIIQNLQKQAQQFSQQKLRNLKTKFQQQVNNLRLMLQQSESKCNSLRSDLMRYEEKLVMLSQEVERLTLQNSKYQQENSQLKRLQFRIEAKQREMKEIQRARQSAFIEIKRDKDQIDRLKIQIKDLWEKNRQLDSKQFRFQSIQNQLELANNRLLTKQKQFRMMQQKVYDLQTFQTSGYRLQGLQSQLQSQRNSYRVKQQQATLYYQKQMGNLRSTINKLEARIYELSSQQSSKQSNYVILAQQIRRLNQVLSQSSQTIINQKRELSLLQSNLQIAQRSLQKWQSSQYTNQKVQSQIQKRTQVYRQEIALHQQETSNLKQKIYQINSSYQLAQQELHTLRLNVQDYKQQIKNKEIQARDLIESMKQNKRNQENLLQMVKEIKESNIRLERKLAEIEQDYMRRLEDKSMEKQQLEKQYIQYNRKIRQAENETSSFKFEVASLKNKLQMTQKRQQDLQAQINQLRNRLQNESRERSFNMRSFDQQNRAKFNSYEQQLKQNAKYIGQLQAQINSKNDQIYKLESTSRQLQIQKHRIQSESVQVQHEKRRQMEITNIQVKSSIERKQGEIQLLRDKITRLEDQIRSNTKLIQSKSKLVQQYENKLAMLSQELQRINALVLTKNNQIEGLNEQLQVKQNSSSKQNKDIIELLTIEITRLNTTLCESLQQIKEMEQEILNKNRQIKRNSQLNKKNQQILKDKIFSLEQQAQRATQQNYKYSANAGVMNKRIQDMQRMEKQSEQLRQKMVEANSEKTRYKNMITDLQSQVATLKASYETSMHQQKFELNSKASAKLSELQQAKRQSERRVTMLVSQNQQLVSQIHNLKRQVQAADEENNNFKKQLIRAKNQNVNLEREKEKYKLINEEVMMKVQKMAFSKTIQNSSKQAYEYQVKHLQGVIKQYESQMILMKQQMQRVETRSRQNSSVGSSHQKMSSNNNSLSKNSGTQLQQKYNILESLHLKLKREADGLRQKVTEYEFKMKKLKGQFDLINKLTHEYKDENQYLRQQNHSQCVYVGKTIQNQAISMPTQVQTNFDRNQQMLVKQTLASQIDRLGILNSTLRKEAEELRLQTVDYIAVRSRYQQMMAIFVLIAVEVEALRSQNKNNQ